MRADPCPDQQCLQRFLVGQVPESDAEQVEAHLARCAPCLQAAQTLKPPDTLITLAQAGARTRGLVPRDVDPRLVEWFCSLPRFATPHTAAPGAAARRGDSEGRAEELFGSLAPAQGANEPGRLGPYRILKVLGSGGMGVVFLAQDVNLQRPVALKVLKPHLAASAAARRRFLREAQAAAAVEHDHIVPIYQVGEDRGVPYLVMPVLPGESLEDRLGREGVLPLPEVLRIGGEAAEGLAAAHARGLIHRDIKPANLWLEARVSEPECLTRPPRVKILDFGLARAGAGAATLTQSGAVLGTPAYMAPEQVRAEEVDHRADLFSLGCVLYRMGTGELPFPGQTSLAVLGPLLTRQPRAPVELNPGLPPALSDLIMRLLAKEREHRVASARDVRAALAAIADQSAPAAGAAGGPAEVAVPTSAIGPGGSADAVWSFGQRRQLTAPRPRLEVVLAGAALVAGGLTLWAALRKPADPTRRGGETQPAAVVTDAEHGGLRPRLAWRGEVGPVTCLAFNPDGTRLAVAGMGGLNVCDARTGASPVTLRGAVGRWNAVAYRPDGKALAAGTVDYVTPVNCTVKVWDTGTGEAILARQTLGEVRSLQYRPDGTRLALCTLLWTSGALGASEGQVWDAKTGQNVLALPAPAGGVFHLAYSPDGKRLAEAGGQWDKQHQQLTAGWLRVCDAATGREIANLKGHDAGVERVAFSPDGKALASASVDGTVRVWDPVTGRQRLVLGEHAGPFWSVAYSPDGKYLVASETVNVRVWSAATGRALASFRPHGGNFGWMAFSPDGKQLATGGADEMVKVWDWPPVP